MMTERDYSLNQSDPHEPAMNPELFTFVPSMKDNERASVLRADAWLRTLFGFLIAVSLMWGTAVKFCIYSYLRTRKKLFDKPLNVLALVDLILNHSFVAVFTFHSLVVLYSNKTATAFVREQFQWLRLEQEVGNL